MLSKSCSPVRVQQHDGKDDSSFCMVACHLGNLIDAIPHHHEVDRRASPVVVLMPTMTLTLFGVMQIDSGLVEVTCVMTLWAACQSGWRFI